MPVPELEEAATDTGRIRWPETAWAANIYQRWHTFFLLSFSTNELYTIFQRFHKTQRGELVKVSSVSRIWTPTALGHRHLQWLEESISQETWETNLNGENCIQNLLNLFNFINYLQCSFMFSAMAVKEKRRIAADKSGVIEHVKTEKFWWWMSAFVTLMLIWLWE